MLLKVENELKARVKRVEAWVQVANRHKINAKLKKQINVAF